MTNNDAAWELNDAALAADRLSVASVVHVAPIQVVPGHDIEVQAISRESVALPINSGQWKTVACVQLLRRLLLVLRAVLWCFFIPVAQLWERLKGPK